MDKDALNIITDDTNDVRDLKLIRANDKVLGGRFVGEETYHRGLMHRFIEWLSNGDAKIHDVFATATGAQVVPNPTGIGKTLKVKIPVVYATWDEIGRPLAVALKSTNPRYTYIKETLVMLERSCEALAKGCEVSVDEFGSWYHFDRIQQNAVMNQLEVVVRNFLAENVPSGMKHYPFGLVLGPAGKNGLPTLFDSQISLQTNGLTGTVMPPKIPDGVREGVYIRRERNIDFVIRLLLEWYMTPMDVSDPKAPKARGSVLMSSFDLILSEIGLRLLGSQGVDALPYKLHTNMDVAQGTSPADHARYVARTLVFQYALRRVFDHEEYKDVINPLREVEINMAYSLRNNEILQNQDYVDKHFKGDVSLPQPGEHVVNWLVFENSKGASGHHFCGLRFAGYDTGNFFSSIFDVQKDGKLAFKPDTYAIDVGDDARVIGSKLIAPKDRQHEWYRVTGAVNAGLLSYERTSLYDQIPSQDVLIVPRLTPFPRYPATARGMAMSIMSGNEGVLGGDETMIFTTYELNKEGEWEEADSSLRDRAELKRS